MYRTLICLILTAAASYGQSISGTVTGLVRDSSGLVLPGSTIVIRQVGTGAERTAFTNDSGGFVVSGLQPGKFDVTISRAGFKSTEVKAVNLSAAETLSLGDIMMQVGDLVEKVTVTAQGSAVQTASSERSGSVTSQQVDSLAIKGRNISSMLSLLPGVVDRSDAESLSRSTDIIVQGGRKDTNSVVLDGMPLNAMANEDNITVAVSQDAIAEVKVLLGNYQAEYGRLSGANIQLITKSGGRDFHGLGSYFKRHEQFNASGFFNNQQGLPKARYRFNTWNYNIGGPVYFPGKFNPNKEKLFFFWSQEIWPLRTAGPITQRTVPTDLERAGNFAQSFDLNTALIAVRDPDTSRQFPGNIIPASRLNASGASLLKVFPLPNFLDRSISGGRYNYIFQQPSETPIRSQTLKLDWNVNSRNLIFSNLSWSSEDASGVYSGNVPVMTRLGRRNGKVIVVRYQRIINATTINELNGGFSRRPELDVYEDAQIKANQRDTVGFRAGQFTPASNPLNIIPNATFGGVTGAANITIEPRFPHQAKNDTFTLYDNFTKTVGKHTLKAGVYYDYLLRTFTGAVSFNGAYDFGRNVNNPLDTGYAYSNAALGVFNTYSEASARPFIQARQFNLEWFAQDNWKVTSRLVLDFGLRLYWMPPGYEAENRMSGFVPARFDRTRSVQLIAPARVNNIRVGVSPVNGQVYPAAVIGAIAPGRGDTANGLVLTAADPTAPRGLAKDSGVLPAPRVGFAYDLTGKGQTAIRGGFGMFFNRQGFQAVILPYSTQSPLVNTPVVTFGTLAGLQSSASLLNPQNVNGLDNTGKVSTVMNFSLSVQHKLPGATVVDIAYSGSLGRHLLWTRNLNSIPFGTNFLPSSLDASSPGTPLSPAFLRPYPGYNDILYREYAGSSNYHSLQVSANRRFARSMQFGGSWTWSKAMDFNSSETELMSNLITARTYAYGLSALDRTHVAKINWLWDIPELKSGAKLLRAAMNHWQLSGIASFVSGMPMPVNFTQVTASDITGSPTDNARIVVTGNPILPKGERTFDRNFRTEVFKLPARGTFGNAARTVIRGPGINNWDASLRKSISITERLKVQFRWELYNAFNHTQFSDLDNTARFDSQGRQVNARFGAFTAARSPRIMQFALRATF